MTTITEHQNWSNQNEFILESIFASLKSMQRLREIASMAVKLKIIDDSIFKAKDVCFFGPSTQAAGTIVNMITCPTLAVCSAVKLRQIFINLTAIVSNRNGTTNG